MLPAFLRDNKNWQWLALLSILFCCVGFYHFSVANPLLGWDSLAYVACAINFYESDMSVVHREVYATAQALFSSEEFARISAGSDYRQVMYSDVDAFSQQLPYYRIRFLYIGLLAVSYKLGLNLFGMMHLLSAAFSSVGLLILYFAFRRYVHSAYWIVFPLFYFHFTLDLQVSRYSGTDTLAFLWVSLVCFAYLRKLAWLFPLLAAATLIRTDLVIFSGLVFLLVFWTERDVWRVMLPWVAVTSIAYIGVNTWADNYGWKTVFYFVFVSDMTATHPQVYSQYGLDLSQYLAALTKPEWIDSGFYATVLSVALVYVVAYKGFRRWVDDPQKQDSLAIVSRLRFLSTIALAYIALHFLLFPELWARFFYGQYLIAVCGLFAVVTQLGAVLRRPYVEASGQAGVSV